jgi:hypothetical protein
LGLLDLVGRTLALSASPDLKCSRQTSVIATINNRARVPFVELCPTHEEQRNATRNACKLSKIPITANKSSARGKLQPRGATAVRLEYHALDHGAEVLVVLVCGTFDKQVATNTKSAHISDLPNSDSPAYLAPLKAERQRIERAHRFTDGYAISASRFARSRPEVGGGKGLPSWWNSSITSSTIWHNSSNTRFSSVPWQPP